MFNAALEERKEAWSRCRVRVTLYDQVNQLPHMRNDVPALAQFGTRVAIGTLIRLDEAFAGYFRRVAAGQAPGYPRFRSATRWDSVQWSSTKTWCLTRTGKGSYGRLQIMGVGHVSVRLHRWFDEAEPAKLVVRRRGPRWEATVCWRGVAVPKLAPTGRAVGLDMGVVVTAIADDLGAVSLVENPRPLTRALARLESAQKAVAACQKTGRRDGRGRRATANARVARLHRLAKDQRRNHGHQLSAALVAGYDMIGIEDLHITNMTRSAKGSVELPGTRVAAKSGLNRSILDAGWGQFARMITYKAEGAGRTIVRVPAPYTSQTCARCGHRDPASRSTRDLFLCTNSACRNRTHADANAAEVVLAVATGRFTIDAPSGRRRRSTRPGSGHPPATGGRDVVSSTADREVVRIP